MPLDRRPRGIQAGIPEPFGQCLRIHSTLTAAPPQRISAHFTDEARGLYAQAEVLELTRAAGVRTQTRWSPSSRCDTTRPG